MGVWEDHREEGMYLGLKDEPGGWKTWGRGCVGKRLSQAEKTQCLGVRGHPLPWGEAREVSRGDHSEERSSLEKWLRRLA